MLPDILLKPLEVMVSPQSRKIIVFECMHGFQIRVIGIKVILNVFIKKI